MKSVASWSTVAVVVLPISRTFAYEFKPRSFDTAPSTVPYSLTAPPVPASTTSTTPPVSTTVVLPDVSEISSEPVPKYKKQAPSSSPSVSSAPSVSALPTQSPTVSPAPSVSFKPSVSPTVSPAPSVSQKPTKYSPKKHGPRCTSSPTVSTATNASNTRYHVRRVQSDPVVKKHTHKKEHEHVHKHKYKNTKDANAVSVSTASELDCSGNGGEPEYNVPGTVSELCSDWESGVSYLSDVPEVLTFDYELYVQDSTTSDISTVLRAVEDQLGQDVTPDILQCDSTSGSTDAGTVVGVSMSTPADFVFSTSCSSNAENCNVIRSGITLYLRGDSNARRLDSVNADDNSMSSDAVRTLSSIQSLLNSGAYDNGKIPNVLQIRYLGVPDSTTGTDADGTDLNSQAVSESNMSNDNGISSIGISIISVGAALVVALVLLVTKRRLQNSKDKDFGNDSKYLPEDLDGEDFEDEEEFSKPDFGTVIDEVTIASYPMSEEEVSVNKHVQIMEQQDYAVKERSTSRLEAKNSQQDVHVCTSAMCTVCQRQRSQKPGTTFISTNTMMTTSSGWSSSPSSSNSHSGMMSSPDSPRRMNHSRLQRPYPTEDTVVL